jgi:uncharacterized protein
VIAVELVYAEIERQVLYRLELEKGATVENAIWASGVLRDFPNLSLEHCGFGIHAVPASLQTVLSAGDRVEIYRPLIADPKETRRSRAKKR